MIKLNPKLAQGGDVRKQTSLFSHAAMAALVLALIIIPLIGLSMHREPHQKPFWCNYECRPNKGMFVSTSNFEDAHCECSPASR